MELNLDLEFCGFSPNGKKAYLNMMSESEVTSLMFHKLARAEEYTNLLMNMEKDLEKLDMRIAESFERYGTAGKLEAERQEKVFAMQKCQRSIDSNHIEACCCFVRLAEILGVPESEFDEDKKATFPLYNWNMIDRQCRKGDYYEQSEPSVQKEDL